MGRIFTSVKTHLSNWNRIPRETRRDEAGFSLLLVLMFVVFVTTIITLYYMDRQKQVAIAQARASGWYLAMAAKAARLHVRNNSLTVAGDVNNDGVDDTLYQKTNLDGVSPAGEISVNELIAAGLLPADFADRNVLGQRLRIYAANYPLNGDPSDPETVATAFVYLEASPRTADRPALMQYMIEGARAFDLSAEAPIFNDAGANVSDNCRGTPGVALWDTNCLDEAEFAQITGQAAFEPGSLMVPAWKARTHDTRAVMRYAQPENSGYSTMLTSLEMGPTIRDADGACTTFVPVYVPDGAGGFDQQDTTLCDVEDDDPGAADWQLADRRVDLQNVGNLQVQRLVAAGQGPEMFVEYDGAGGVTEYRDPTDEPRSGPSTSTAEVIGVAGNLQTENSLWATGRMPNPTGASDTYAPTVSLTDAGGTPNDLTVDHVLNVASQDGTVLSALVSETTSVNTGQAEGALQNNVPGASARVGTVNTSGYLGSASLSAPSVTVSQDGAYNAGVVTLTLNAPGVNVMAENADILGVMETTDVTITGGSNFGASPAGGSYNTIVGELLTDPAQSLNVTGNADIENSLTALGTTSLQGSTFIGSCFSPGNDCPEITEEPPEICNDGSC